VNAVEASDLERRRIAADLHDGVVQRLAGTAYSLAAAAERLPTAPRRETKRYLDEAVSGVRTSMRELRSLIVEIYPPSLASQGLEAALSDLAESLTSRGITVEVDVAPGFHAASEVEKLLFRGAQEAVRNVAAHARAGSVVIRVTRDGSAVRLVVDDDGVGIGVNEHWSVEERDGHLGLTLLGELAGQMEGTLTVAPRSGGGTRLCLEVPDQ
jgi:signal transduction histidine kinase